MFQFTLPAWRATPRSAHAVSPFGVSIHAPRMESDIAEMDLQLKNLEFQFTLPAWRATEETSKAAQYREVSIHAPRMESDDIFVGTKIETKRFQFTLPAWRATVVGFPYDFIVLLLFISANQEKAYFFACFFGFSSLCCLWFAPVLLILFSRW